jgi:hypothetical protein
MLTSFGDIDPISLLLDKCLENIEDLLGDLIFFPFSYYCARDERSFTRRKEKTGVYDDMSSCSFNFQF